MRVEEYFKKKSKHSFICIRNMLELRSWFIEIMKRVLALNGQTALATGLFPMWVLDTEKYVDNGIFFRRYRKEKIEL